MPANVVVVYFCRIAVEKDEKTLIDAAPEQQILSSGSTARGTAKMRMNRIPISVGRS
jgi:hypothetical protein